MKKALIVTSILLCSSLSINNIQASDNRTEEQIGFGSGLIIGALAGGPVGAIIGAASGAWIGEKINAAEKVPTLNQVIAENKVHLLTLKKRLIEQNTALDESRIALDNQQIELHNVAQQKQLLMGLQVDVMFRTNSSQLEISAIEKIAPLVLMLEYFPQLELQLTGHGDLLGTEQGNTIVAHDRTLTVQQSFVNSGIEHDRIHLLNSGRNLAVASVEDTDGRALERRVRIQFIQTRPKPILALQ